MCLTKNGWRTRLCKMGDEGIGYRISARGDEARGERREAGNSGFAADYQPLHSTLYALHSTLYTSKLQTKAPTDLTDLHGNTEYVKDNTDNK